MRLRARSREDEAFDGLTAQEVRRIRGAAEANVTPGLESLAPVLVGKLKEVPKPQPKNKRGRRA